MKNADIHIDMLPVKVIWTCPYCGHKEALPYKKFMKRYDHDWQYATYRCEKCGETYYFGSNELQSRG